MNITSHTTNWWRRGHLQHGWAVWWVDWGRWDGYLRPLSPRPRRRQL